MSNTVKGKTVRLEESLIRKVESLAKKEEPKRGRRNIGNFSVMIERLLHEALKARGIEK